MHSSRIWGEQGGRLNSPVLSKHLSYSYQSFHSSLIHMSIQSAVDNQRFGARQPAQVRREASPASSVLFVDSSLMKMGTVLNYITKHKAVLRIKAFVLT